MPVRNPAICGDVLKTCAKGGAYLLVIEQIINEERGARGIGSFRNDPDPICQSSFRSIIRRVAVRSDRIFLLHPRS